MSKFFKILYQRLIMIIVITVVFGLIGVLFVSFFYNPRHEVYEISFKSSDSNTSLFNNYDYINDIKNKIEDERDKSISLVLNEYKIELENPSDITSITGDNDKEQVTINYRNKSTMEYGILKEVASDYSYIIVDDYWYNIYGLTYEVYEEYNLVVFSNGVVVNAKTDNSIKYSCNYSSFSYINSKKIAKTSKVIYSNGIFTLSMQKRYFNTWQQARRFMLNSIKYSGNIDSYITTDDNSLLFNKALSNKLTINEVSGFNEFLSFGIGSGIGLLVSLVLIAIFYSIKKEDAIDKIEYDNVNIFKTIFHKEYFKRCVEPFKDVKSLIMMSIILALMITAKFISLPSGFGSLGISLGIFPFAIAGALYGPVAGALIGFMSNTIGFFLAPNGYPFHIGYGLTAALSGMVYGVCFYKTKITYSKCLFARLVINIVFNGYLGSVWWAQVSDLSHEGMITYMLTISMPKNLVYLLPQSIAFYLVFKALRRVFKATNLINAQICDNMTLF